MRRKHGHKAGILLIDPRCFHNPLCQRAAEFHREAMVEATQFHIQSSQTTSSAFGH